jgi:hypothetical protein
LAAVSLVGEVIEFHYSYIRVPISESFRSSTIAHRASYSSNRQSEVIILLL